MVLFATLGVAEAVADPEYLFATTGCIHMAPQSIAEFVEKMNIDLHGCIATDHELARVYRCGDGGSFLIFWDEKACNAAVQLYNKRYSKTKSDAT